MSASGVPVTVPGVGVPAEAVDIKDTGLSAPCPVSASGALEPPVGFVHGARVGGVLDASWTAGLGSLVADFRSDPDVTDEFDVPADFRTDMDQFVEARGLTVTAIDSSRFRRLVSDGHMGVPVTFEPLPAECRTSAVNTALDLDASLRALGHPGFVHLARQLEELDASEFADADPVLVDVAGELIDARVSVVDEAAFALGDLFAGRLLCGDVLEVTPVCPAAQVADQLLADQSGDPWGWLAPTSADQGAWSASSMLVCADALETALALEPSGLPAATVDLRAVLEEAVDWAPSAPLLLTLITGAAGS